MDIISILLVRRTFKERNMILIDKALIKYDIVKHLIPTGTIHWGNLNTHPNACSWNNPRSMEPTI